MNFCMSIWFCWDIWWCMFWAIIIIPNQKYLWAWVGIVFTTTVTSKSTCWLRYLFAFILRCIIRSSISLLHTFSLLHNNLLFQIFGHNNCTPFLGLNCLYTFLHYIYYFCVYSPTYIISTYTDQIGVSQLISQLFIFPCNFINSLGPKTK